VHRQGTIELHPRGVKGPLTHLSFTACLYSAKDVYQPPEDDTPPRWQLAEPTGQASHADVIVEMYDSEQDRSAVAFQKRLKGLHQRFSVDFKLPFPLKPSQCLIRFVIAPADDVHVFISRIAPYRPKDSPRHVVMLSLDTHALQLMSLDREQNFDTSPALRQLAESDPRALLFTGGLAASHWTLPTHATMFTGLYPTQHGLVDSDRVQSVSPQVKTLHELLASRNVATFHLISHTRLGFPLGYYRGVDVYRRYTAPLGRRGRRLLTDAIEHLAEARARDTFMFVHLFDAHLPYRNWPKDYRRYYKGVPPRSPDDLVYGRTYKERIYGRNGWRPDRRKAHRKKYADQFDDTLRSAKAAYQLGLRDVDNMLAAFFTRLREKGLWDNLSLVIVSDHGEEFFEHGLLTHTSLYDQNLRVPFLIRIGESVPIETKDITKDAPVSHTFEAHTTAYHVINDLFGVTAPAYLQNAHTHALSLGQLLSLDRSEPAFAEYYLRPKSSYHEAAITTTDGKKLILSTRIDQVSKWQQKNEFIQLFDARRDPGNQRNLFDPSDPQHEQIRQKVIEQAKRVRELVFSPTTESRLSEEQRRKLRALGYIQ